ncbi:MAG: DNA repair protein RecO [Microgenomates bacterium OLB22]|nr:MAG: DNA repair protein RecO [Microgenomates bacterium OLB22]
MLTQQNGLVRAFAYGVRSLKSKRIAHLEIGNMITAQLSLSGERHLLGETELVFGFTGIKNSSSDLNTAYYIFAFLARVMPEGFADEKVFKLVFAYLSDLNKSADRQKLSLDTFLTTVLLELGYVDQSMAMLPAFSPHFMIEELIGKALPKVEVN